jgi:hypothetical protein
MLENPTINDRPALQSVDDGRYQPTDNIAQSIPQIKNIASIQSVGSIAW